MRQATVAIDIDIAQKKMQKPKTVLTLIIRYFIGFFIAYNRSNANPRSKKIDACIPVVNTK